jgi:hypothetical protein
MAVVYGKNNIEEDPKYEEAEKAIGVRGCGCLHVT